jgi:Caspase domain
VKRIGSETKIISSTIGLKRHFKSISTSNLSSEAVLAWIKKAHVKKNDIFLFYFSGHGLKSQIGSKWPRTYFSKKRETLELKEVIAAIRKKGARLSLILCDSCNNLVFTAKSKSTPAILEGIRADGLKQLFLKNKGSIVLCAAKPNKRAWSSQNGGFMTLSFLLQLRQEAERPFPSWGHLAYNLKKFSSTINDPLVQIR